MEGKYFENLKMEVAMLNIPLEFILEVKSDIIQIEKLLNSNADTDVLFDLHMKLDGKYQSCIKGWGLSMYCWNDKFGFYSNDLENSREMLLINLKNMKNKLFTYTYKVNAIEGMVPKVGISLSQNQIMNITVSFSQVIEKIEKSNYEDKSEILSKIHELEDIINSNIPKKDKWEKVKNIGKWIFDKSVDVGIALLPLMLKI